MSTFKSLSFLFVLSISELVLSFPARADAFGFSFTNTIGNVAGTVTGAILGLANNATGPASQVIIESFPGGLNSIVGSAPLNATAWGTPLANQFTETDGQITGGMFEAQLYGSAPSFPFLAYFALNEVPDHFNGISLNGSNGGTALANLGGIAADNFHPLTSVTGTIGGKGPEEFYYFGWGGGSFSAVGDIEGLSPLQNLEDSYFFSVGSSASLCNNEVQQTLDAQDNFTSEISIANLPAGNYCIGFNPFTGNVDPTFTLTFNTPVENLTPVTLTPEPNSGALLLASFLAVALTRLWGKTHRLET